MALCLYCSRIWHGQVQLGVGTCRRCVVARSWNREMAESESHDGKGFGDHDLKYAFGSPRAGLTLWQQAHLLVMRGQRIDHRGAVVGDDDFAEVRPSGLYVPYTDEWRD